MRKIKISLFILSFSLFAGNLVPIWSNFRFETSQSETVFFVNSIDSNVEINAIPAPSTNTKSAKSVNSSTLHQAALQFCKNSLPELHNHLIKIDQKTPKSFDNKYLNFIYDFQTIK